MNRFEEFLLGNGVTEISISAYMRSVRSTYNRAIQEEYAKKDNYPFQQYKISRLNTKTKKRAINKDQIKQIMNLEADKEVKIMA